MENVTILIIDDEQDYLDSISNALQFKNYSILQAVNGKMGCRVALKYLPDIIITDWDMPDMNGIETLKQLKSDARTKDIPVIMATGMMTSPQHLETALQCGAYDYLRKPVDKIELVARINASLNLANSQKLILKQIEELSKLNATKDKFFSIIAHDLRNPFLGILGFSEILENDSHKLNSETIQEYSKLIHQAARHTYHLLENLLKWARSQQGKMPFNPVELDLKEEVDSVFNLLWESTIRKNITLVNHIPENLKIHAEEEMLQTIIRNLISNAIKFTSSGGLIQVNSTVTDGFIGISVSDTGIGMTKDILDDLFRLDSTSNRQGTVGELSTGLGLILCKEFVEKHGGKIWVESEVGKGSTFYFSLKASA